MKKLFVDDTRECPRGYDFADNYDSAVFMIKYFDYDHISLDYSLNERYTGLDIMRYIHDSGRYPKSLNVHSDHSEGIRLMRDYAKESFPEEVAVTFNTIAKG